MPPKGTSTKLQPMRLPPLPRLRVRRPNQADANPCLAIMSSVLSMPKSSPQVRKLLVRQLMRRSVLGLGGIQCCRMSGFGDAVKSLYGYARMSLLRPALAFDDGLGEVLIHCVCRDRNRRRRIRLITTCRGCIRISLGLESGSELAWEIGGEEFVYWEMIDVWIDGRS